MRKLLADSDSNLRSYSVATEYASNMAAVTILDRIISSSPDVLTLQLHTAVIKMSVSRWPKRYGPPISTVFILFGRVCVYLSIVQVLHTNVYTMK